MAKRTGDIELAGVLTTPAGPSAGVSGEDLSLTAGAGNTTGDGGSVNLISGNGGGTTGDGGALTISAGSGGGTGDGGDLGINAGSSGGSDGDGGNIDLNAGKGYGSYAAGDITLAAGIGNAQGGNVALMAGGSGTTYSGGNVTIDSGYAGTTGDGGAIIIRASGGGVTSGTGGGVTVYGGAAGGGNSDGGNITLQSGLGAGAGSAGAVVIPDSIAPTTPANKLYSVGGVLSWNGTTLDTGGGGISSVVEDTTPQLGGALDGQGFAITDATYPATINAQVGVTYTAVLADADKIITLTNAAAIAMTIPANASVAYPIGTKLNFQQLGAGAVTVGITTDTLLINSGATLVMNGQNSIATALKITATSWVLFGQLVPAIAPLTSVAVSDLDDGTDGELITWDAAGVATTVLVGTATHVLTSNGTGAAPTFQVVPDGIFTETGTNNIHSGTFTGSGDHNFLAIDGAGVGLTTGSDNILIGENAGSGITINSDNVVIGRDSATGTMTNSSRNVVIGTSAFQGVANSTDCIAIGFNAGNALAGGDDCIAIGQDALGGTGSITGGGNIAIGQGVMGFNTSGGMQNNTAIGDGAGGFLQTGASYNVMLGFTAGSSLSTGSNNTFIGRTSGNGFTGASSNNVTLGVNAGDGVSGVRSNQLIINNVSAADPLISGDFSTKAVHFGGSLRFKERADHIGTPTATFGEIWVKSDTPNVLVFTDDAGTDTVLGGGGISNVVEDTTPQLGGDLDVNGYSIIGAAGVAATNPGDPINITAGAGNTTGAGGGNYITAGAGGATGNGGGNYILGGAGGATSGNGGNVGIYGGIPVDGTGGNVSIYAGSGYGTDQTGGALYFTAGSSQGTGAGGPVSIFAASGGATGAGGAVTINAGDGGATSGAGGDVTIIAGEGDTADNNGAIVLETGTAGAIETIKGYIATNSTGASALIATIPLTSGDSTVYEVFAVARQDSGTESAAFRIFGGVENTGGTAALIGSSAKDRTDDGGASVDWDVTMGVSSGNLTITLDNDAETVDWKIKVRLTEL